MWSLNPKLLGTNYQSLCSKKKEKSGPQFTHMNTEIYGTIMIIYL